MDMKTDGKLQLVVEFGGKEISSLESENNKVDFHNFTVELEDLIIKQTAIINESMIKQGITDKQLRKLNFSNEKYAEYLTQTKEMKITVNHMGFQLLSIKSGNNVLPHQMNQSFEQMSQAVQRSLDKFVQLNDILDRILKSLR